MLRACLPCLAMLVVACGLPRDADGTIERAKGGILRVGVVDDPPWATPDGGGVEGALATELAREIGATPMWIGGPEAALLAALHERELDLVIGGLTGDTPWGAEVALTKPFYIDTVAVAPAGRGPHALRGLRVAVRAGDAAAADLRKEEATPVLVRELAGDPGPIAAPTWRLEALGHSPVGRTLRESPHVLAVAPGENAWLVRVERLLRARRDAMPAALRAAARDQGRTAARREGAR